MIVPIQERSTDVDEPPATEEMLRARRIVASAIMPARPPTPTAPPIAHWQAWLVAGWMAFVTIAYATRMLGIW